MTHGCRLPATPLLMCSSVGARQSFVLHHCRHDVGFLPFWQQDVAKPHRVGLRLNCCPLRRFHEGSVKLKPLRLHVSHLIRSITANVVVISNNKNYKPTIDHSIQIQISNTNKIQAYSSLNHSIQVLLYYAVAFAELTPSYTIPLCLKFISV